MLSADEISKRKNTPHAESPPFRSPLRYPGGKSRAAEKLYNLLPPRLDRLCSPFVGGGSFELLCAQRGIEVKAYDNFEPLVNFWQVLLEDAPEVAKWAKKYHPITKTQFYSLQKRYSALPNRQRLAAAFYALNRSSFSGTTFSGGMSPEHPRFTEKGLDQLAEFKVDKFSVELADFEDSIKKHKDDFLYLDPPYANGGKLYGERGDRHEAFDHSGLAKLLRKRDDWLLSYNDCEDVRALYKGCKFSPIEWAYGMNKSKESNEILISPNNVIRML